MILAQTKGTQLISFYVVMTLINGHVSKLVTSIELMILTTHVTLNTRRRRWIQECVGIELPAF